MSKSDYKDGIIGLSFFIILILTFLQLKNFFQLDKNTRERKNYFSPIILNKLMPHNINSKYKAMFCKLDPVNINSINHGVFMSK